MSRDPSAKKCLGSRRARQARAPPEVRPTKGRPTEGRARSPEMRLADFCNLHFKDEHPSRAWFPAFAEQPGESTLPDSLRPSQPRNQDGYSPSQARKDRSSDVPVIQRNSTRNRESPNQRPIPPTTREDCGLPRPRTPSTSKQPSAGSSPAPRFRESGSRRHFTHSDRSLWARPSSPTSAATEVASLSPTPLADFCNQNRARAHRPSDWSSPAARFRASQCFRRLPSFGREQHEPGNRSSGSSAHRGTTRAGRESPSQRARSGAEAHSKIPEHLIVATSLPAGLESPQG
jgi:hypothetical protein